MTKIAFLGLGAMGSRMAGRLLSAGHAVTVWNRSPERADALVSRGANVAKTPRAAAQSAEIVFTMLTDDEAARSVWLDPDDGALAGMQEGALAVESSTLTPACIEELAGAARAHAVAFVDAPVAGSRPQAEAGQLIYLLGGAPESVERLRPLLDEMGGAIHHVGPSGSGAAMKLAVNALFGIQVAAMAEVLSLLERSGITPHSALEVLGSTPVVSPAAKGIGALIAARKFAPMFPIALVEKDFRYVHDAGVAVGGRTPTADGARALYREAIDAGRGGDNIHAVSEIFR